VGSVTDEEEQAGGRHADPEPLTRADLEAEHALREHGQEHDAGGQHGLDDGQRREREGEDVQDPGAGGDRHADGEPARGEQRAPLRSGWRTSTDGAAFAPLCL
jgi:hypothetical protein